MQFYRRNGQSRTPLAKCHTMHLRISFAQHLWRPAYLPRVMHSSGYHPLLHWQWPRATPPAKFSHARAHRLPGSPLVPALPQEAKPEAQNLSLNQVLTSPAPSWGDLASMGRSEGARTWRGSAGPAAAKPARVPTAAMRVRNFIVVGDKECL